MLHSLTTGELAIELHGIIKPADQDAALAACEDAMAAVLVYMDIAQDGAEAAALSPAAVTSVRKVAKRLAVRLFTNPQERASYAGPEGLSYQISPNTSARILTADEREQLDRVRPLLGFA